MTSKNEFLQKYGNEGLRFEVKSARNGIPPDFWETYSAFANTFGGTVVFGISEDIDRKLIVTGVENPANTIKTLWDNLNNPKITNINLLKNKDVRIESLDGLEIIVIEIPQADRSHRPVYIHNNINSGTFKRNHEGDYHCRMDEIKEMIRDSTFGPIDMEQIGMFESECFDYDTIGRFLRELSLHRPNHPWANMATEDFLQVSNSARMTDGKLHPTLAGLLMFGKGHCIRNFVPNYFMDYLEISAGNRWDYRIHTSSGEFSGNIYDFISQVVTRLSLKIGGPFTMEGFAHVGTTEAFISAREAVINAVFHADYLLGHPITIKMFGDRLEISNPGSMRVRIQDAKKGGRSDSRNGALMNLALALGWVERIGSGIHMIEQAVETGVIGYANLSEYSDPSSVLMTIGFGIDRPAVASTDEKIIEILSKHPNMTMGQLSEFLGIPKTTVVNKMNRLKARGRIVRIGSNKTGYWEVK